MPVPAPSENSSESSEEEEVDREDDAENEDGKQTQLTGIRCNVCNMSFSKQSNLNAHNYAIHLKVKHLCPNENCVDDFTTSSSLRRHLRRVHGSEFDELNDLIPEQQYVVNEQGNYERSESSNIAKIKRLTVLIEKQDEEIELLKNTYSMLTKKE